MSDTPAALPFYKSPLFILIVTAFLTRLVAAFPGVVSWVGLSDSSLQVFVTGISLAVGGVADLIALRLRATSKLQPLTTTQAKADQIVAGNPSPVEVKKDVPPVAAWFIAALLLVPLVASLTACASLSFQEQLAAAYGTYTTVENAADQAYTSGAITKDQAESARSLAKQVRPFLDAAQAASTKGDATTASQDLTLASTALGALQQYVNAQLAAQKGK